MPVSDIVENIVDKILEPLITLIFAVALVYFLWGAVVFIRDADSPENRDTGRRHMLYGIIGMFIMVTVIGILRAVTGTFGVSLP